MTFAWYGHLKFKEMKGFENLGLIAIILISWGLALFEYMFQVPANRIGFTVLSVGQLKIIQEVITLSIFVPFAMIYMRQPFKMDYIWAGFCLIGAVYFIFRS